MSRETENTLLLLVGVSIAMIAGTGMYTRYVKPSLLPWLVAAAVLVIVLAVAAIARDVRRGHAEHHSGDHGHRSGVLWLLLVPVVVLIFVTPPPIGARAAGTTVTEVSTDILRRPFPPLPTGRAPAVSLPDVLIRAAQDTAGTLDDRLITVTGFTLTDGGRTDLARVVIICCAADARLARIHLAGPAAAQAGHHRDETWLSVEGIVRAGQGDSTGRTVPVLEVSRVRQIAPPANPYAG